MNKTLPTTLCVLTLAACGIAQTPYEVPARHQPLKVMGRDFWRTLYRFGDWAANATWATQARNMRFDNPEITALPAFAEAVPEYFGRAQPPPASTGLAMWPKFAQNFLADEPDREILTKNPHPDWPLSVNAVSKRNPAAWAGPITLDHADYAAWRAAHPNLLFDGRLSEWDNDLMMAYDRLQKIKDPVRRRDLAAFLGERPKDRYERVEMMRKYYNRRKLTFYDGKLAVLFAHVYSAHLAADFGTSFLILETTNTSGSPTDNEEYRWNTAPMFTRGAARQFGVPWEWYIAGYMNGYSAQGTWQNNAVTVYPESDTALKSYTHGAWHCGPEFGQSANLLRRVHYLAYLSGANFANFEEWTAQLLMWDAQAKKTVLSPRARFYQEFAAFAKTHPNRGAPYTPVAIGVPRAQGYTAFGGRPWAESAYGYTAGDHAIDAVFFTLVPGFERAQAMKRGEEHNLHNTPYAQMYDVIAPDAQSQSPAQLLDVLRSYKAFVLVGDYPDRRFEKTLAEYERLGGRVVRIGADEVPAPTPTSSADILAGREKFPRVAEILNGLQSAYFPFKVSGDCLYGLNRTPTGWWLWVFNNKGVTKFADTPERIDPSATAKIHISSERVQFATAIELISGCAVATSQSAFDWQVPAGDLAIFEIK